MAGNKDFEEDFSDLEIQFETATREELAQDPEVQKTGKKISRSRLVLAIACLVVLVLGATFLFSFTIDRAANNPPSESSSIY